MKSKQTTYARRNVPFAGASIALAATLMIVMAGCDGGASVSKVDPTPSDTVADTSADVEATSADDPRGDVADASPPNPAMSTPEEYRDPQREHKRQIVADGKPQDLTFDDLKFDIEVGDPFERSLLTEELKALDGKQITLGGFIRPTYKQDGLESFIFVRDNKECCFGPQAAIYDCVLVKLKKGTATSWSVRPIRVSGTFYLKEYELDGLVLAIFRMKNAKVVN